MAKLKNGFDNPGIKLVCGILPVTHGGKKVTFPVDKYKSIRIKKKSGDWPDKMTIYCDKDYFGFIFPEIIQYEKNNEINFSIPSEYRKEIDDFEIQIKCILKNEISQGSGNFTDPDTTVTIGDAKPTETLGDKKNKG